jgi:hypothetical protein|tara:strand:- start:42 stop:494 length:453 start_codon:yes stop_codon:yes gene_type:complete
MWSGNKGVFEYIILISVVAAGVCGIVITKNVFGSDQIHGKLKNRYVSYISDLETDNKKLTGKLNKMKQNITINENDFDKENPLGSIAGLISQFAPMLPKNIQPLLQSPEAMGFIEKMVKDNPEKVGELIGKFVKKPKGNNEQSTDIMESV